MLMTAERADKLGLKPLAVIKSYALTGCEPEIMGIGPGSCYPQGTGQSRLESGRPGPGRSQRSLCRTSTGRSPRAGLGCDKVNVNGGAIALGHPIGASGCRVLVTLLHEMQRRDAKKGLATLCIGGGMGVALAVERP